MNKLIKLIVALSFILLVVKASFAMTDTFNINSTQIPYVYTYELLVNLTNNSTVFIERTDTFSLLQSNFTQEANLTNESTYLFYFTLWIDANITKNESEVAIFNISSDKTNKTYGLNIVANIEFIPPILPATLDIEEAEIFMNLIKGNYLVNLTSNLLPVEKSFNYVLIGTINTSAEVICADHPWFSCPDKIIFNESNMTEFEVLCKIPINAPNGKTEYPFSIKLGNITRSTKIILNIREPDIDFLSYIFTDSCYVEVPGQDYLAVIERCVQEQEEFNLRRLTRHLEEMRKRINVSQYCPPCEPVIEEKLIFTGEIEEVMLSDLTVCKEDRRVLNNQVSGLFDTVALEQKSKSLIQKELNECNTALFNNDTAAQAMLFDSAVRMRNKSIKKEEEMESNQFWHWVLLIMVILIILFVKMLKNSKGWKAW